MTENKPAKIREDVFTLEEGDAVMLWPDCLWSQASFNDVKVWLHLVMRKIERHVSSQE